MKMQISPVKPRSHYNHYSNENSQGALICQSENWPLKQSQEVCFSSSYFIDPFSPFGFTKAESRKFDDRPVNCEVPDGAKHTSAYLDRISQWDYDRYKRANKIAGTGCQGWARNLPQLNEETLKEFAAVALNLEDKKIWAVRATHYYNASNGYSCPVVEAIYLDD